MENIKFLKGKVILILKLAIIICNLNVVQAATGDWNIGDKYSWAYEADNTYSTSLYVYGYYQKLTTVDTILKEEIQAYNIATEIYDCQYELTGLSTVIQSPFTEMSTTDNIDESGIRSRDASGSSFINNYNSMVDLLNIEYEPDDEYYTFNIDYQEIVEEIPHFLTGNWYNFNNELRIMLNTSDTIYESYTITDFLSETEYLIMGKSSLNEALEELGNQPKKWTFDITYYSIIYENRIYFEIEYDDIGVLEKIVYVRTYLYKYESDDFISGYTNFNFTQRAKITVETIIMIIVSIGVVIPIIMLIVRKRRLRPRKPVTLNSSVEESVTTERKSDVVGFKHLLNEPSGIILGNCSICKLEINEDQNALQCSFCNSVYHKEHIEEWLKEKFNCPVCSRRLF